MEEKLREVYNPDNFKKAGYELIDLITDYLVDVEKGNIPVNNFEEPETQLAFWKNYELGNESPATLFKEIIDRSIHVHNPKYMGHQISPTAPISVLASMVSALLNNGMAIYEMGSAATSIEKVLIERFVQIIGWGDNGDGFLTSGGTIGNLTALLAARQAISSTDVWENGLTENLGVMVSSEAHYSVDRAIRIMGLGNKGIIKIPVSESFTMRTELLNEYYEKAIQEGIKVIAVVGSAPSTSTGMYDDLDSIAKFCTERKIWFHVDGAHGGAAIFSKKYKHLLQGVEQADSIVIDGHKMLMTPSIMTFLLYKEKNNSYSTFSQKAKYLLGKSDEEEWYNLASRTIECTKLMMSIKFYSILQCHGEEVFGQFVNQLYDIGKIFARCIKQRDCFELALEPDSNIVCFRFVNPDLSEDEINDLNSHIRNEILKQGNFYIVQTILNDIVYFRVTLMNPNTDSEILDELLDDIEKISKKA